VNGVNVVERIVDEQVPFEIYRQTHPAALGGLISPRDFAICRSWKIKEDGSIWLACVSVEDEKIPQVNSFVRGDLMIVACSAQPTKEDPSICRAQYLVHTDIKGSLPHWLVNKGVVGEMTDTFNRIQRLIDGKDVVWNENE